MNKFITDLSESLTREQENGASLVEDSAEINGPQQNLLERGASIARQLHQQEMAPQRRSTRSAPEPPAELQPAKRAKRDKAQKPEYVKRTHSKSEEDYPKTRSKSPEIKLPPQWPGPLLYPFEGPKRTNVDHEDLNRLKNSEFLNDNIINFYLRYLEEGLREKSPSMAQEFHFFNTFFYERLSMKTADKKRNMDGVLKWTAKIDLFKKNYVIVPINER